MSWYGSEVYWKVNWGYATSEVTLRDRFRNKNYLGKLLIYQNKLNLYGISKKKLYMHNYLNYSLLVILISKL